MEVPAPRKPIEWGILEPYKPIIQAIGLSAVAVCGMLVINDALPTLSKEGLLVLTLFFLIANANQTIIKKDEKEGLVNLMKTMMLAGCVITTLIALKWI